MRHPEKMCDQLLEDFDTVSAKARMQQTTSGDIWVDFAQHLTLLHEAKNIFPDFVVPAAIPV